MEIQIHHQEMDASGEGMWFVKDDETNEILAKVVYHAANAGNISLDSTVVSDVLRGKNIGKRLVNEAASYARAKNIKLIPVCPFIVALFERVPGDYADVAAT
jgi:uncharacterized protein